MAIGGFWIALGLVILGLCVGDGLSEIAKAISLKKK